MMRHLYIAIILLLALAAPPAAAQEVPSAFTQGVLIKSTLVSFHDAITTGNFDVLYAKTAAPFQKEFAAADLAAGFKEFIDEGVTFLAFVGAEHIDDAPAEVTDGVLTLLGHYQLEPGKVAYRLRFMIDEGAWRLIGINVDVKGSE
jgi:hypothetical protein